MLSVITGGHCYTITRFIRKFVLQGFQGPRQGRPGLLLPRPHSTVGAQERQLNANNEAPARLRSQIGLAQATGQYRFATATVLEP